MLRNPIAIALISAFVFFSFSVFTKDDGIVSVLNKLEDDELKERLVLFEMGGVEIKVNKSVDIEKVIKTAESYRGCKHKMGGLSNKGIDCSGLVKVSFASAGLDLPHSSLEQARYGKIIPSTDDLERGDLVFFCKSYHTSKPVTHSGIFLGDTQFIHTSSSAGVSVTSTENPYWKDRFLFGTRLSD